MGIPILVLGESGSGKSASMRNFDNGEVGILNVASKPLPFRKKLTKADGVSYEQIASLLSKNQMNCYVIDDSQYLMCFEAFEKAKEVGYGKFTDIALNFRNLLDYVIRNTSSDTIVYFMHHIDVSDTGKIKAKTIGKMLDSQLTLEGLFSVVLMAEASDGKYKFVTQSDGTTTCKSPMEMFDLEIDNDLKFVDDTIRDYWGLAARKKATKSKSAE